jgi:hypothetical protein
MPCNAGITHIYMPLSIILKSGLISVAALPPVVSLIYRGIGIDTLQYLGASGMTVTNYSADLPYRLERITRFPLSSSRVVKVPRLRRHLSGAVHEF